MSLSETNRNTTPVQMPADTQQDYTFTPSQDWFTHNIPVWEPLISSLRSSLPPSRAPRALEVGSWEGRSAVYLLTTLCTSPDSLLLCIDHFDLFRTAGGRERFAKLSHNLRLAGSPFRVIDDFSVPALMTVLQEEISAPPDAAGFDFVYLDGSHEADDTFLDAELAWRLARQGALFVLDDYAWDKEPPTSVHHPARGIDAFLALHAGQFHLVSKGYQVILRKTTDMRIGFLTKAPRVTAGGDALHGFDHGLNVVLCADAAYAMPAAVAIRSAVENTPGRMTVYIVDCGLRAEDVARICESVPSAREDVTLVFRTLPAGSRGTRDATWAKVDMLLEPSVLPVERILLLDADVLVRRDLRPLWTTDLRGRTIAAARDIGHPLGHRGLPAAERGRPHFNAGVVLFDLPRVRERIPALVELARARADTAYKDQDLLNAFVPDGWLELDVAWNAGGLGTYATWADPHRDAAWPPGALQALHVDPAIVHFTGPVHPSVADVLNGYVQPWTSKPWGFAGAPGNPFEGEWWEVLGRTAWRGVRQDERFLEACAESRMKARENGIEEFEKRVKSRVGEP